MSIEIICSILKAFSVQNVEGREMRLPTPCPFCRIKKKRRIEFTHLISVKVDSHCRVILTFAVNTRKFYARK